MCYTCLLMMYKKIALSLYFLLWISSLFAQDLPIELRIQDGHYSLVTSLAFSPDGKLLASGAYDRGILLWDMASGRELRRIECEDAIQSLDFSPNGRLLLSVLDNGKAQIHEVESGTLIRTLSVSDGHLYAGKFLPNGKEFITSGPYVATLWSLKQQEPVASFEGERSFCEYNCGHALAVSPDGKWMVVADRNGEVTLWNIPRRELVKRCTYYEPSGFSHSGVTSVLFLPDSRSFVVGSEIHGLIRWPVDPAAQPHVLLPAQPITSGLSFKFNDMAISRDGGTLVAVYLEAVQDKFERPDNLGYHIFDLKTEKLIKSVDVGNSNEITCMAFSPVSDTLILNRGAVPQIVRETDATTVFEFKGHLTETIANYWIMRATKKHLLLHPATVVERVGKEVISWDLKSGRVVQHYAPHTDMVLGMALSSNEKWLATGGADRRLIVSEVASGDTLWTKEFYQPVFTVAFSPEDTCVYTVLMGGQVAVWNARTGQFIRDLPSVSRDWYQTPMSLAFTNTGLVAWGEFLRSPEDGKLVVEFDSHTDRLHDIQTLDSGKTLLTTGWDGRVILRSLYYGAKPVLMGAKLGDRVYCAAVSPDEKWIATGAADNLIRIYDRKGNFCYQLTGHQGGVVSLTFSADGHHLISGSQDGTVKVWDVESQTEKYTHILLDEQRWTVMQPSGHFYATDEGMKSMYFVQGKEIFHLDQFFEAFYQPQLTTNLLGQLVPESAAELKQVIAQLPPEVKILYPPKGESRSSRIELLLKITDQGGGIDEVKILQNGKRIAAKESKSMHAGKSYARSYYIDLVPGLNVIQASAFGQNRIESKTDEIQITLPADEPTSACYVLAIGINQYKNPTLNLNYAADDAESVAELIEKQGKQLFTRVETRLLINEDATRENILKELGELARVVKPTDVFYFFYAGHGSNYDEQFYFVPSNCTRLYEPESLTKEALPVSEIVESLKAIPALKQVLFIDACHSGSSTAMLAERGASEEKALAQLSRSAGVHILAAAGSDQAATEFQELGHGVFTYTVLEALQGKADGAPEDHKVTVYELKSFLDDQVPEYSLKYKHQAQYPNTFSIGHDFPIVLTGE